MKPSEALRIMTKLAAFFPGTPEATTVAYASKIGDVKSGDLEAAIDVLIETAPRFPTLGQIFEVMKAQGPYRFGVQGGLETPALPASTGRDITFAEYRGQRPDMAARWDAIPGRTPVTEGQVWDWDTAMDDAAVYGWGKGGPRGGRPRARVEPEATS